ncbi:MAG: AmmeMemoRadiSam system radical SAM enzyme [Candidatus Saliniplasma sp.]
MKEAMFWEKGDGKSVQCHLCGHHCDIKEGNRGICGVRENQDGKLYSLIYGKIASVAIDPIEKKPLYHFKPRSKVLSFGTVGCNFRCKFCQNASLSCGDPDSPYLKDFTVDELVKKALDFDGIAWTYNEPAIDFEFSYDVSKKYKEEGGGYVVYVTNGFMEDEPLEKISPYLDAMNIDIKAMSDKFYSKIVGGRVQKVLDTAAKARELGIHIEVTYLIIPEHNDSQEELREFSTWVKDNLGEDTVTHFSKFHPDHNMKNVPATPSSKMDQARKIAEEVGLNFVYLGNLPADNDTRCPKCGEAIIKRSYFSSGEPRLKNGRCPKCGRHIPIIL